MKKLPIPSHRFILIASIALAFTGGYVIAKSDSGHHSAALASQHDTNDSHESGAHSETASDLTDKKTVAIDIKNYAYSQPNITIKKGTTVTWTNQDGIGHDIMKAHGHDEMAHGSLHADEVSPDELGSTLLKKGESYSFTFNQTGTFVYHCSPHPYMQGMITVAE